MTSLHATYTKVLAIKGRIIVIVNQLNFAGARRTVEDVGGASVGRRDVTLLAGDLLDKSETIIFAGMIF